MSQLPLELLRLILLLLLLQCDDEAGTLMGEYGCGRGGGGVVRMLSGISPLHKGDIASRALPFGRLRAQGARQQGKEGKFSSCCRMLAWWLEIFQCCIQQRPNMCDRLHGLTEQQQGTLSNRRNMGWGGR
jgi:hypothetical protein